MRLTIPLLVLMGSAAVFAPHPIGAGAQTAESPGDPVNGKAVYLRAGCDGCHGTMGHGGPGGRLAPNPIPATAFNQYVRNGKVRDPAANRYWSGMPPYSVKFISDSELADVHAYLRSIPDPPPVESISLLND